MSEKDVREQRTTFDERAIFDFFNTIDVKQSLAIATGRVGAAQGGLC
jgi:hypothetical protein